MGEIADEMLERYLEGDFDEWDDWYTPAEPIPGVARPEMPVIKPTDFKDCT